MTPTPFDIFLFAVLPYAALAIAFLVGWERYRRQPFTYSSLSSQFLENRHHFWGSATFHYGVLVALTGHLLAFAAPGWILAWNGHPVRLYLLEVTGFVFGLSALAGLGNLILRRLTSATVRIVTTTSDWILFSLLLAQVGTGILVALLRPWGSSWFATTMTPYLRSLFVLQPDVALVAPLPWLVKTHIIGFFVLLGALPYSRLVHAMVAPIPYLWRKPQVVRWYGRRSDGAGQPDQNERLVH